MKITWRKFYDTGAGGGGGGSEKELLLQNIQAKVENVLEQRGYKNAKEVQDLIGAALKDVNIEALRNYDPSKVTDSVTKLAGDLEILKAKADTGAKQERARSFLIRAALDMSMDKIERVMASKEGSVTINLRTMVQSEEFRKHLQTRALENPMTTVNVTDVSALDAEDFLSFALDTFVPKRRPREYVFDLVNRRTVPNVTENIGWWEEGTEDGAFALVAEGAVKPLVSKTLVMNKSVYFKVAGKRVYTEEFAKFRREAYTILEDLFNDQMIRNYAAIITTKVQAEAASYVGTALDGQYTAPTDYHAIGAAAAQIEALDFNPDLLILNPQDKWRIALQQTSEGAFYLPIPMYNQATGTVEMMGFTVVTTNRQTVGTFTLGERGLFKVQDEPVTVRMGYGINVTKNGEGVVTDVTSDFDNNRFRIISEMFAHAYLATNHAGSFVTDTFADVKAALTATP